MVIAAGVLSVVAAVMLFPLLNTELAPQTDEGVVTVSAEMASGTRIERTDAIMSRLEQMVQQYVPEARTVIASAGGGMMGASTSRGTIQIFLAPKDERTRSNDEIAFELRRQLSGIPGVIVRANASGGNNQINNLMSGGVARRRTHGGGNPRRRYRRRAENRAGRAGSHAEHAGRRGSAVEPRGSETGAGNAGRSAESRLVRSQHDAGCQHHPDERGGHDRCAVQADGVTSTRSSCASARRTAGR